MFSALSCAGWGGQGVCGGICGGNGRVGWVGGGWLVGVGLYKQI